MYLLQYLRTGAVPFNVGEFVYVAVVCVSVSVVPR